jgi:hypothetical protein
MDVSMNLKVGPGLYMARSIPFLWKKYAVVTIG